MSQCLRGQAIDWPMAFDRRLEGHARRTCVMDTCKRTCLDGPYECEIAQERTVKDRVSTGVDGIGESEGGSKVIRRYRHLIG